MEKSPPNIAKAQRIHDQLTHAGKHVKFIMVTNSPCYKENDLNHMPLMVKAKQDLPKRSLLHLRYEDILHDPYKSASQILDFLPALESLDPSKYGLERNFSGRDLSVVQYILEKKTFHNLHAGEHVDRDWEPYMSAFGHYSS